MGAVYRAFDPELARVVAIKVIRLRGATDASPAQLAELRTRLVREARTLATLSHPNVVAVYDVGLVDGEDPFLTMEFLGGRNFRALFSEQTLTLKQILPAYLGIARGLAAAHAAGIVHRDIKPENCVAADDGRYCVIDFGLVTTRAAESESDSERPLVPVDRASPRWTNRFNKSFGIGRVRARSMSTETTTRSAPSSKSPRIASAAEQLTHVGGVVGTSSYMAPEQTMGRGATARSDVFSFCLSLYEALVGENPFSIRNRDDRVSRIAQNKLRWPHTIPRYLRASLERGLQFDPVLRPSDLGEWLSHFEAARHRARRNKQMAWGACIVGVSAAAAPQLLDVSPQSPDCGSLLPRVSWEGAVEQEVGAHLQEHVPSIADDVIQRIDNRLSELDADFQSLYRAKCVLETKGEADRLRELPSAWSLQEFAQVDVPLFGQCLAHREAAFRAFIDAAKSSTALRDVLRLPAIASALPSPRECIDTENFLNESPQPQLPASILEVQRIREEIVAARMLVDQGRIPEGVGKIQELGSKVRTIDFMPLSAEWWAEWARAKLTPGAGGSLEESVRWFEDALILSISAGHRKNAADVSTELAVLRTYHLNEHQGASEALRRADAYVRAAGEDARRAASLERALAIEAAIEARYADGLRHFQNALARIRSVAPEGSGREAMLLDDVAYLSIVQGAWERAIEYGGKSLDLVSRLFGPIHPRAELALERLATANIELGRLGEASEALHRLFAVCSALAESTTLEHPRCLQAWRNTQALTLSSGGYSDALSIAGILCSLGECDRQPGRYRSNVSINSTAAEIFARRGELNTALELSRIGREELEREPGIESAAIVSANAIEAKILIEAGELDRANAALLRASASATVPSAELRSRLPHYQLARSAYFHALGEFDDAMQACEEAKARMTEVAGNPLDLANAYLQCAKVQLARGDATAATEELTTARQMIATTAGLSNHVRYEFRLLAAKVFLHQQNPYSALDEVEAARLDFDPVEIRENQLAPLDFVEAKSLWMIDRGPQDRVDAHRAAKRAFERFRSWDHGAQKACEEVERWLAQHPIDGTKGSPS
jgi:serine/threonine-protein kinase